MINSMKEIKINSGKHKLYAKLWMVEGNAPTILLLHGLGFYSFEYEELAPLLAKRGYNCLALDFQCCGESEGKRGYWTLEDYIENTKSTLNYIRTKINDKIGVFGNSLGATVAVYTAADDKEHKIKSLVASNCATRPVDFGMNNFRKFLLAICGVASKIIPFRVSVNHFIPYNKILSSSEIIKKVKNDRLVSNARRFAVSTYKDMFSWDASKIAGQIEVPVLVLSQKENDDLKTRGQSMLLYSALKEPKELKFIDAGHVPDLENAGLVSGIISAWFDKTLK